VRQLLFVVENELVSVILDVASYIFNRSNHGSSTNWSFIRMRWRSTLFLFHGILILGSLDFAKFGKTVLAWIESVVHSDVVTTFYHISFSDVFDKLIVVLLESFCLWFSHFMQNVVRFPRSWVQFLRVYHNQTGYATQEHVLLPFVALLLFLEPVLRVPCWSHRKKWAFILVLDAVYVSV